MRTLLRILFLTLVCFSVKAQSPSPSGLPSPYTTGYYRIGWIQNDSGYIPAYRDTFFIPKFQGTEILWLHAGVDTAKWVRIGNKWTKYLTLSSLTGTGPIVYNPATGNISCPTCGSGSGGIDTLIFTNGNGFSGAVTNPTTAPNISIGTSVTGILFGNGTALGAATVSAPLTYFAGTLGVQVANTSQNGYLSSTDWNTFNGKINLTSLSATSPVLYNNTTGLISEQVANTSQNGYLSSTDWNTFNGKQAALSGTGYPKFTGTTPAYLTPTQVTADLNLFSSTLKGLVPLSGGGTTNFLRADGTWAAPPGGGSVTLTNAHIFVGSASNAATDVALSGDIGITNAGLSTIQANAVTTAKIINNAVTYGKIQAASGASLLGATGAGNFGEITLGTGLSFAGSVLNAASGGAQTFQQTLTQGNVLTKADTVNQNGNLFYFTGGGTLLADTLTLTPNPVNSNPTGISLFSNSFGVGLNSTNNATKGYGPLLAAFYNIPLTNYSVSGTGIWTAASNHLLNINPGNTTMSVVEIGFNDPRYAGNTMKTILKLCNGINAIFSNHFLKSWMPGGSSSTSIVRSGAGWSALYASQSVGGKSNGNGAFTSTLNDSLVYTFVDSTVTIGLIGQDGVTNIGANFDVFIDGVLKGHYTENNQYDGVVVGGSYDNKRGPMSLFYTGLTNASHKIKLINTSATGTAFFIVDYVGNLLDKKNTVPLVIYEIPKMDATGYATSPANSTAAITNIFNASIDSTVALFPVAYPVALAKTNNFYTFTNPLTLSSDHIHPTDSGHVQIAQAAEAVIALSPAPSAGTLVYLNGDLYMGLGNGQKTKVSRQSPAAAGITGNIQFNNSNILAASNAFNFLPSTNYMGVGLTTPTTALDIANNVPVIRVSDTTTGFNNAVYFANFQDVGIIGMNRNPGTGTFKNTSKAAANIQLTGNSSTSFIDFLTASAVNTVPSARGRMFGNGDFGWGSTTDNSTALMQISGGSAQLALHRDATHYTLLQTNSDGTFVVNPTGITTKFVAPTAAGATLNLIPSSAINPTSPNDGDLWYNGTNLDFRHAGVTTDLLGAGSGITQLFSKNSVSILGTDTVQLLNDVATPCKGCAYMARPILDSARGYYQLEENSYGIVYQKATWANLNDFNTNGTTASIVSNKIQLTGGAGTFTQTLDLKGTSCLDKWQTTVVCHVTSVTGSSFGLGIGKRSTNTYGSPMTLARVNFATGGGQLITNGGSTPTQISSSATALTISANDRILIICKRDGYQLTTTTRNITTNSAPIVSTYTYSTQPNAQPYFDNTGTFSLFSLGGTMIVDSLCVTSDVVKNARLGIIGDSKVQGFDVTAQGFRWSDLVGKKIRSTINLGGGYDRTIDVSARVPEIIRLKPQQIIMSIGSNDVRSGVDSLTYCTRYDSIVTALTNAGIDVYHAVLYETSISMLPLWNHINQVYAQSHIIDTYDAMQVPNVLDVDGVHPLNYGDSIAANTTLQTYALFGQNERYTPSGSEAMNWTSPATFNVGTQLAIPINVLNFSAKNNTVQFGTFGVQSVANNNAFFQEGTHFNGSQQVHDFTGFGELIQMTNGDILFSTSPSGTIGTSATYTGRLTVKNTGNIVIGNGSTDLGFGKLQVLGSQGIAHYADATHFVTLQSDISGNGLVNASNGLVGISVANAATTELTVGTNRTGANNALGGLKLLLRKAVFSDNTTAASGTVANVAINTIGQDSLTTAVNTGVTYTNAFTTWIEGAPVLTLANPTSLSITNAYAFGVGSGKSLFGGIANYSANFGSSFTTRTHVDKGYVDSAIAANIGGGAVSSVSNSDGTLTISPTTGAVIASLALAHANTWTGKQTQPAPIFTGTTSAGANDSVMTIDPATGQTHWRSGTINLKIANGLSAPTTDSIIWGGTLNQTANIAGASFAVNLGTTGSHLGDLNIYSDGGTMISNGSYQSAQGSQLLGSASTINNAVTSASGTVTNFSAYAFLAPTITSTNASITYNKPATLRIDNAPTMSTNSTATGSLYALDVVAGISHFGLGTSNISAVFDGSVSLNTTPNSTYGVNIGASTTSQVAISLIPGVDPSLSTASGDLWYNGTNLYFGGGDAIKRDILNGIHNYRHTIFTPTTGGTVSLVANQYNIINPAGALVALTVNLPSSPNNNDLVYIKFTQTVSTVTYANGTVIDGITAPTAGGMTVLVYDQSTTSWY